MMEINLKLICFAKLPKKVMHLPLGRSHLIHHKISSRTMSLYLVNPVPFLILDNPDVMSIPLLSVPCAPLLIYIFVFPNLSLGRLGPSGASAAPHHPVLIHHSRMSLPRNTHKPICRRTLCIVKHCTYHDDHNKFVHILCVCMRCRLLMCEH